MPVQKRYQAVIRQFVHLAHERYPHGIERIILYGSVARGDAGPDSDIDLLVLWKGDDQEGWRAMTGIAFDVMVATESHISVKVIGADTFSGSSGFEQNVLREGIEGCVIGTLALPGRGIVAPGSSRSHSPPTSVTISPARREWIYHSERSSLPESTGKKTRG